MELGLGTQGTTITTTVQGSTPGRARQQDECLSSRDVGLSERRKKAARYKAKPVTKAMEFG